ncbi:hypothetical protein ACH5RR_011431 [Cinchona calisaya]|uniref:Uncharacterized protein n=1 Tax=Cinchona calisaya TaxID=153742 RepID=A0ABD3A4U9_9GENT
MPFSKVDAIIGISLLELVLHLSCGTARYHSSATDHIDHRQALVDAVTGDDPGNGLQPHCWWTHRHRRC